MQNCKKKLKKIPKKSQSSYLHTKCKKETKIIPKHLICIRNTKKETKIIPKHLICI